MIISKNFAIGLVAFLFCIYSAYGADDPSIKGKQRKKIQAAMKAHVEESTLDGKYVIFDGKKGKLLGLKFEKLHNGIVKKGEYFVSCADFSDGKQTLDVDLLAAKTGDGYRVYQTLVHKSDGEKRPYSVE